MIQELISSSNINQLPKSDLRHDSAKLAAGGRYTVSRRSIAGRENLSRDHKRGRVGPKVLEEVGKTIQEHEGLGAGRRCDECVVAETFLLQRRSINLPTGVE